MVGIVSHDESTSNGRRPGYVVFRSNFRCREMSDVHREVESPVELVSRAPSLSESALAEYSKTLVIKSLDNSIDFHKTMLGVSATFGTLTTTLIPILSWGDKDATIPLPEGWFLLAPPIMMLLSAVCFALGFFPRSGQVNPNELTSVDDFRTKALRSRRRLATAGMVLFSLSVLGTVALTVIIRARGGM